MKIKLTIILMCSSLMGIAQSRFIINGTVTKDFDNQVINLSIKDDIGRRTERTESATVKNQKFSFKGTIETPVKIATIEVAGTDGQKNTLNFVLDTGLNNVSLVVTNKAYGVLGLQGKLSQSNFIKSRIDSTRTAAYASYRKAKNIQEGAVALPSQEYHQLDLDLLKLLQNYPNDYYALRYLYILCKSPSMLYYQKLVLNTLNVFSDDLKNTDLAIKIVESCEANLQSRNTSKVGQKMFDFEMKNLPDGKILSSKQLEGKPYIIAFSATWCIPCHERLPQLKAMYEKYHADGLEVIYYNQDSNVKEWEVDIKKNNLQWINISEMKGPASVSSKLGVRYIPTYFVIDKKGDIIYNSDQMDVELVHLEDYIKKAL